MLNKVWFGEGDATPIVALHEGLGSVAGWARFCEALASSTGSRVLAYDRLGYGQSPNKPGPWPSRFMHDGAFELANVLQEEGLSEVVLLGHSDGASIALLYLSQNHLASTKVASIVSLSGHAFIETKTVSEIQKLRSGFSDTLRRPLARQHLYIDDLFSAWSSVWVSDRFRDWSIDAEMASVECPVLVVQGLDDAFGTWEQVERIEAAVAGPCQVVALEGVNHWPHREATDLVLASITSFLA